MNIVIVGRGNFGSALTKIYEDQRHNVHTVNSRHSQAHFPKGFLTRATAILCVPTQEIPQMLAQRGDLLSACDTVVSTAKGILRATGQTPLTYLSGHLKKSQNLLALSGPSFAAELAQGQPTALVLAGRNTKTVDRLCKKLSTPRLRLYKSHDPLGVELCGALKNVYAIASGLAKGLGFGDNTHAALNTRALSEMTRIGHALGGKTLTFFGLAGVGDLFLTCSSHQSRNFQFGLGLSQGKSPDFLLKKLGTVEGVWTAAVARKLCQRHSLRAPLLETIVKILEHKMTPQQALAALMSGKVRHEFD